MWSLLLASCFCGHVVAQDYENNYTSYTDYDNYTDYNVSYHNFLVDLANDPYYQVQLLNLDRPKVWYGENWFINASSVYGDYTTKNLFDKNESTFWLSQYGSRMTTSFIESGV